MPNHHDDYFVTDDPQTQAFVDSLRKANDSLEQAFEGELRANKEIRKELARLQGQIAALEHIVNLKNDEVARLRNTVVTPSASVEIEHHKALITERERCVEIVRNAFAYTAMVLMHKLKDGQYVVGDVVRGHWSQLASIATRSTRRAVHSTAWR
jgi:predicted nuclease with TOPRIM domain